MKLLFTRVRALLSSLCSPLRLGGVLSLSLVAVLWGCGGVGSGGTGGFADAGGFVSGPITGFGSVIVNDVRFDDSSADISDGDGQRLSRDDLRLGMTVEIESGRIAADSSGTNVAQAVRIKVESELRGPVAAVDVANNRFTLLGQQVQVSSSTLFGEGLPAGLSSMTGPAAVSAVEVYAVFEPSAGAYRALRVDAAAASASLRVRGPVQQVDALTQTVRVGAATYPLRSGTPLPAGLSVGQVASLHLQTAASGQRLEVSNWRDVVQPVADAELVKLRGVVSSYTSLAKFTLAGRQVDASAAHLLPPGAVLALGVQVEAEGPVRNGVLQATKVTLSNERDDFEKGYEVKGAITEVVATAQASQPLIVVRGQVFSTSRPDLRFENGTAAQLTVGRQVEVKGQLGSDGRTVEATRIKFQ